MLTFRDYFKHLRYLRDIFNFCFYLIMCAGMAAIQKEFFPKHNVVVSLNVATRGAVLLEDSGISAAIQDSFRTKSLAAAYDRLHQAVLSNYEIRCNCSLQSFERC